MPGTVREADLTGSLFRIDIYIYQSPSVPEYNINHKTSVLRKNTKTTAAENAADNTISFRQQAQGKE